MAENADDSKAQGLLDSLSEWQARDIEFRRQHRDEISERREFLLGLLQDGETQAFHGKIFEHYWAQRGIAPDPLMRVAMGDLREAELHIQSALNPPDRQHIVVESAYHREMLNRLVTLMDPENPNRICDGEALEKKVMEMIAEGSAADPTFTPVKWEDRLKATGTDAASGKHR